MGLTLISANDRYNKPPKPSGTQTLSKGSSGGSSKSHGSVLQRAVDSFGGSSGKGKVDAKKVESFKNSATRPR
jgi:hypothetical protein